MTTERYTGRDRTSETFEAAPSLATTGNPEREQEVIEIARSRPSDLGYVMAIATTRYRGIVNVRVGLWHPRKCMWRFIDVAPGLLREMLPELAKIVGAK